MLVVYVDDIVIIMLKELVS